MLLHIMVGQWPPYHV